jgi:prepilin-type N-terminal cleavage/methylation domain-containing protein
MARLSFQLRKPPHQAAGFTLIEVMIVVGIIAILASIALPSYRDYILRGQIVDATTGLASQRGLMEQYFQDNRTYQDVTGFTAPCVTTFGSFAVSCSARTATTYTLSATGSGPTNGFTFTMDQTGARATTFAPPGWGTCGTRWVLKKGDGC